MHRDRQQTVRRGDEMGDALEVLFVLFQKLIRQIGEVLRSQSAKEESTLDYHVRMLCNLQTWDLHQTFQEN